MTTNVNNCECKVCGKSVYRKPSHLAKIKNVTCSRSCMGKLRAVIYRGKQNPNFGNTGVDNPIHKGYRTMHCGYYWVYLPEHPFAVEGQNGRIREHRVIAEQYHLNSDNSVVIDGVSYLSPKFDVHHKNENRLDNRPSNLEITTRSEHSSHHALKDPVDRGLDGRFTNKQEGEI